MASYFVPELFSGDRLTAYFTARMQKPRDHMDPRLLTYPPHEDTCTVARRLISPRPDRHARASTHFALHPRSKGPTRAAIGRQIVAISCEATGYLHVHVPVYGPSESGAVPGTRRASIQPTRYCPLLCCMFPRTLFAPAEKVRCCPDTAKI